MDKDKGSRLDDDAFRQLVCEVTWTATLALRSLYRLHDGDGEAVGRELVAIDTSAAGRTAEPVVIKVEMFGAVILVTLREYAEEFVDDWEIGLEHAREVLTRAPRPFVYNEGDAIRHPEYLQLHTAVDEDLLRFEIERLGSEDV
jgi:hypothetical protein